MLDCLKRVKEAGQTYFPDESKIWIFPAPGGHVAEVKEEGDKSSLTPGTRYVIPSGRSRPRPASIAFG